MAVSSECCRIGNPVSWPADLLDRQEFAAIGAVALDACAMQQGPVASTATSNQDGLWRYELVFPRGENDLAGFQQPLVDEVLLSRIRVGQLLNFAPGHRRGLDGEQIA